MAAPKGVWLPILSPFLPTPNSGNKLNAAQFKLLNPSFWNECSLFWICQYHLILLCEFNVTVSLTTNVLQMWRWGTLKIPQKPREMRQICNTASSWCHGSVKSLPVLQVRCSVIYWCFLLMQTSVVLKLQGKLLWLKPCISHVYLDLALQS